MGYVVYLYAPDSVKEKFRITLPNRMWALKALRECRQVSDFAGGAYEVQSDYFVVGFPPNIKVVREVGESSVNEEDGVRRVAETEYILYGPFPFGTVIYAHKNGVRDGQLLFECARRIVDEGVGDPLVLPLMETTELLQKRWVSLASLEQVTRGDVFPLIRRYLPFSEGGHEGCFCALLSGELLARYSVSLGEEVDIAVADLEGARDRLGDIWIAEEFAHAILYLRGFERVYPFPAELTAMLDAAEAKLQT